MPPEQIEIGEFTSIRSPVILDVMSPRVDKQELHRLIDLLPENVTWDDLKYWIYIVANVEEVRHSARTEPLLTNDEVRARFGLPPLDAD